MMRALVTGGSGQVGKAVTAAGKAFGFACTAPSRAELDLANPDSITATIDAEDWSVIINCGAYTAVDKAQTERDMAHAINRVGPGIIAQATALRGIPVIHVSTDYVFDGERNRPYRESDRVSPVSVYGMSKEGGESAVRMGNPRHAILRTAWVLSATGGNFINTMLRLGETQDEVRVVNDQRGCPTSADDIAQALLTIAGRMTAAARPFKSGTWHFVNGGEASWFDLAHFTFARAAASGFKIPKLVPIPTSAYPTPAERPANSRLDTAKFTRDFGYAPRPWQEAIGEILDKRLQGTSA